MAKLSKIIKIKQADYSTLLSEGQVTIGGVTHVYDSGALYTVVDPAAPEYAESAGYAANAGTAQVAVTDTSGNNIVQTYGKKPLVIEINDDERTIPNGTFNSITQAIKDGKNVVLKYMLIGDDDSVQYLNLVYDYEELALAGEYHFNAIVLGIISTYITIYNDDSLGIETFYLVQRKGTETISGNKTFKGTTTFTGNTNLGSKATATTPAATDNDTSVATTAFVKTAVSGKQNTLISGTNIKTVNGNSLLGEGNVDVTPQFKDMHFGKSGADNDIVTLITDQGYSVDYIVTSGDPQGAAAHASSVSIPTIDYLDTELNKKVTKLVSPTDNTVVRFDGVTGNIKGSGVTIDDCNHIAASKFITCGGTSSQFVKADGSLDNTTYLNACSLPYWANIQTDPEPKYNSEPEFKLVKINGSTTNTASTENAVIQYDTTTKVIKFVFN